MLTSNHKRQRIAPPLGGGSAVGINDVPEPILASIATYLEKPVRPLLAMALTAPSSSWVDCNWKKGPSSMGRAVLSNDLWEELDFSLMPRDLASRLTDADLGGALACIDAANKLRKLYLSQCINVSGSGLELLRGSAVLEEADLRTGIRMDDEDAVVVHRISPAVVVPILESILTKDGSSLEKVLLNKSWRDDNSGELKEFVQRYRRILTQTIEFWERMCIRCGMHDELHGPCGACGNTYCGDCCPSVRCDRCLDLFCDECGILCLDEWSGPICKGCFDPRCPCTYPLSHFRHEVSDYPSCCSVCKCAVHCTSCSPDGRETAQHCRECGGTFCLDCRFVNANGTCSRCFEAPRNVMRRITAFFSY